jgi:hypothetical protein
MKWMWTLLFLGVACLPEQRLGTFVPMLTPTGAGSAARAGMICVSGDGSGMKGGSSWLEVERRGIEWRVEVLALALDLCRNERPASYNRTVS